MFLFVKVKHKHEAAPMPMDITKSLCQRKARQARTSNRNSDT